MPRRQTETTLYRKELIYEWASENRSVTVRQIFYQLSTLDVVPKTEKRL
jgi:DNA topoisomerase VI subunit A